MIKLTCEHVRDRSRYDGCGVVYTEVVVSISDAFHAFADTGKTFAMKKLKEGQPPRNTFIDHERATQIEPTDRLNSFERMFPTRDFTRYDALRSYKTNRPYRPPSSRKSRKTTLTDAQ